MKIVGNVKGLNSRQVKTLERLFDRKMRAAAIITAEFAHHMTAIAAESHRKIGVLMDRRGHVEHVVVGDALRVDLPDIGRQRAGVSRLRGLRLLVATPTSSGALTTADELTDLSKLRLDLVCSVEALADGRPGAVEYAHVVPGDDAQAPLVVRFGHVNALEVDFLELIAALEEESERKADRRIKTKGTPALLVHIDTGEKDSASRLKEMHELCRTANVEIVHIEEQRKGRVDPKFVVGSGKLKAIELSALDLGVEVIIFDRDLTPPQSRAITNRTELKVIDRTQLILDIFAQRATSHDGKLQVELAQLKYMLPKLIQKNTAMSRLTGGIGGRGPGETKLEVNRRRAHDRIALLEGQLSKLGQQRQLRRSRRKTRNVPIVSIVGYTNAGKSTLLNTLTNSEVLAEDKLFATLDPTSRRLRFPKDREIVLTDTVGFIRDLPKDLVAAFKATLEELDDADVLVHVVDIADPDFELHIKAVRKILDELGLEKKSVILVFNKADVIGYETAAELAHLHNAVATSALDKFKTAALLQTIEELLWQANRTEPALSQAEVTYSVIVPEVPSVDDEADGGLVTP
ncbi:MAG: GTPase HflX [Deltaproteobacteria bacterium CG2_30_63_29]|nr:MAG: GTPase HflX [Deltaproteobacteria bacterium CG2_30_63_29]